MSRISPVPPHRPLLALAASAALLLLPLAAAPGARAATAPGGPTCFGYPDPGYLTRPPATAGGLNVITGTSGDDVIIGSPYADLIDGGGGIDRICGAGGDDVIIGADGGDVLDGGADADTLYGGIGADSVHGGTGDDYLSGEADNDILAGEEGADEFVCGTGTADIADGGVGRGDVVQPGHGCETLLNLEVKPV